MGEVLEPQRGIQQQMLRRQDRIHHRAVCWPALPRWKHLFAVFGNTASLSDGRRLGAKSQVSQGDDWGWMLWRYSNVANPIHLRSSGESLILPGKQEIIVFLSGQGSDARGWSTSRGGAKTKAECQGLCDQGRGKEFTPTMAGAVD